MGLVAAEVRKVTSTRLWWGLLLGGVVLSAVAAGFAAGFAGVSAGPGAPVTPPLDDPSTIRNVYATSAYGGTYLFALILGIVAMTAEYRYQTITPTLLATPRRARVVVAKFVSHLGFGVLFALVGLLVSFLVGGVVMLLRGADLGYGATDLWPSVLGAVLAVMLWTLIGIGVGTLLRNQVVAILVAVLFAFVIEPLVGFGLSAAGADAVVRYFPSNAATALTTPPSTLVELLPAWAGGLVLLGYALVFAGLGLLLTLRRDVS